MTTATVPAIERRIELRAAPERVWRALTDPTELGRWFGQRAELVAEPGADGWMEWDGHGRFALRIEVADAPHHLSMRWMNSPGLPFDAAGSSLVEWRLEAAPDGGTILHLRESGFTTPDGRAGNAIGWLTELGELVALIAEEPWQAGIRRTSTFSTTPERVWRAFADPVEFASWWGGANPVPLVAGAEGWWEWPVEGRYAVRVEVVEPPTYLAWSWTTTRDVPIREAFEVLRTEWAFEPRDDGGTDLHLLETGFRGPENHGLNGGGWDTDVLPALRRSLAADQDVSPGR